MPPPKKFMKKNMDDVLFKKIYDSYIDSMKKSARWISQSVSVYQAQRDRILG